MDKQEPSSISPGFNPRRILKRTAGALIFTIPVGYFTMLVIDPIVGSPIWTIVLAVPASLILTVITCVVLYIIFVLLVWLSMISIAILCFTEWIDGDSEVWSDRLDFLGSIQPLEAFR